MAFVNLAKKFTSLVSVKKLLSFQLFINFNGFYIAPRFSPPSEEDSFHPSCGISEACRLS